MAHQQQMDFMQSVKEQFPSYFDGKLVLDIGSLDINGNNGELFENCLYLGIDLFPGRNVDLCVKGHELQLPDRSLDVIVSSECFEHDRYYVETIRNIVRMLSPGGLFFFSCATTGRQEHGTRRSTPEDAPFIHKFDDWGDYYLNLEEADIRAAIDVDDIFQECRFSIGHETHDLYFWGIKRGELPLHFNRSFQLNSNVHRKQITALHQTIVERDNQIGALGQMIVERDREMVNLRCALGEILSSRSWRVTRPLRGIGQLTRSAKMHTPFSWMINSNDDTSLLVRVHNAVRYLARGDFSGLANRYRAYRKEASVGAIQWSTSHPQSGKAWGIMATPHTLFIATLIAERLQQHGWGVDIMTEAPATFSHDWYVVICPQLFNRLPPGDKRIPFQLEQSVSSRWFNDEYFKTLENSLCMFDYALKNVEFLAPKGIVFPHVHYLPIGATHSYAENLPPMVKSCDVLFYGDCKSSARRRKFLDALAEHFDVRIASEVFGREMQEEIRSARVVINLHYYENALLEMPRIQECLSLGVPVVSEWAQDQADYPELDGAVSFFAEGSIPSMIAVVRQALDSPVNPELIERSVAMSARRFAFMFDRFLIAVGYLPASAVSGLELPLPESFERVAISLPETIGRRQMFEAERPRHCAIFDGIRRRPGWIGCGLSYQALAFYALRAGRMDLTVMEDDVILPVDFEEKMVVIRSYLQKQQGQWDVFAGVIASLHDNVKVLSTEDYKGMTFVTIDKMTSTVFNIYSEKALRLFAAWNPENLDAECNTIDRFLENQAALRVVVALPFLVGHREEVYSTLWGFQNTQYIDMIATSEKSLQEMVLSHQEIGIATGA